MSLLRRLINVFRPARLDRELNEELEFHRQMSIRRARERGLDPAQAELEARHRIGNLSAPIEEMRDARLVPWLMSCLQDLRHGFALLRRDAFLSALIVLVLALGIGGNTAIFTLMKAAFADPLPYPQAGRLVTILDRFRALNVDQADPTIPEFSDIRARASSFEQMAFLDYRDFQISGTGEPARVFAARVTASFFSMLGVHAAFGRTFAPEENQPGQTNVVVLTDAFWRSHMGADPDAIGKTIRLNDDACRVVGVLPPGFAFDYPTLNVPESPEIYVPYVLSDYYVSRASGSSNVRRVRVLARLRQQAQPGEIQGELENTAQYLVRTYPALYRGPRGESTGFSIFALPLRDAIVGKQRRLLWLMLGCSGALLMIACANSAQLLLARGLRRGREVAIRIALGASRQRLIRQFVIEGFVLAGCGGVWGLLMSGGLVDVLVRRLPERSPVFEAARTDWSVVAFTLTLSVISALSFSVLPAIKGSTWMPGSSLTARDTIAQGNRWRHVMIAIEAGLSVFLLCGAGLIAQNLWTLVTSSAGFDPKNLMVVQLRLPWRREQALKPTPSLAYRDYLERVSRMPGVDSVAVVTGLPIRGAGQTGFGIVGGSADPGAMTRQRALIQSVSPDYFRTLRIPLVSGRAFSNNDIVGRQPVAIVNREFVRRFGKGGNMLGRQIRLEDATTIVGVVGDIRMSPLATAPEPQIYVSYLQLYEPDIYLVVRSPLQPALLMDEVKQAVYSVYSDQALFHVATMDEILSGSVAGPRLQALLIGAFALLALTMAASGMYSVISCLVSQRTSEIAIRMALGADRLAIARTIIGATSGWVLMGLSGGLLLGLATRKTVRLLSNATVGGSIWVYGSVALLFFTVALLAAWIPTLRASRVDPAKALRCE